MVAALTALTLVLWYFALIKPVHQAQQLRAWRRFQDQYAAIKLKYVRIAYENRLKLPEDRPRMRARVNVAYDHLRVRR